MASAVRSVVCSVQGSRAGYLLHCAVWLALLCEPGHAQSTVPREWSDSTGTFKVVASLVEVKDDVVFLKAKDGKTRRIPVARLSAADQQFLKGGINPFEEVSGPATAASTNTVSDAMPAATPTEGGSMWRDVSPIDWDSVEELDPTGADDWNLKLPAQTELSFTPKRAILPKKNVFHEDIRRLEVNPTAQRAVVGYTVSFGVPKPQSRLSLIELSSGKGVHTAAVEANMCPLALLNDGSTVLMYGTSDERGGFETPDQLQLWRVAGKKVVRSQTWVPFPEDAEHFGKKTNAALTQAIALPENKLLLLAANGHLACVDAVSRKPLWHARLASGGAIDASLDGRLIAILDGARVMIVASATGRVEATTMLEGQPHVAWPKIKWSPSGKRLIVTFTTEMRVLDSTNGEWIHRYTTNNAPIAPNALSYPHDDYALLENRLLLHIPSQIKVCEYRDAGRIAIAGGTAFIGLQAGEGGLVVPAKIPHPAAQAVLTQAEKDPSVFLIHPGVEVSIDANAAGQYSAKVAESLRAAAEAAGYKIVSGAPISIVAAVTGPKQEAVSYIAAGSYIATVYNSTIKLTWQGKEVWSTAGTNFPSMVHTSRGESIQDKLNELGKTPNLSIFEKVQFPKLLQRPSTEGQGHSDALLVSKFTMQGLVDSK